jgi:hypothetical protein
MHLAALQAAMLFVGWGIPVAPLATSSNNSLAENYISIYLGRLFFSLKLK